METERKLDVLADIARALNQSGVTWAVGGSLLLYFKGKTGVFRDIDLMVCETDVEKLKQAMLPLGAPAPSDPNAQYRTRCFLEFTVRGVDVDVMAGFVILENGQEHDCALILQLSQLPLQPIRTRLLPQCIRPLFTPTLFNPLTDSLADSLTNSLFNPLINPHLLNLKTLHIRHRNLSASNISSTPP